MSDPDAVAREGMVATTLADMDFYGGGKATAQAMTNAAIYFDDVEERQDWSQCPTELSKLEITHLRMLGELSEHVGPKLRMLTGWSPRVMSDQTVKLAATSVLNEKLAARERSHSRTLQWIAGLGTLFGAIAGFALGKWLV